MIKPEPSITYHIAVKAIRNHPTNAHVIGRPVPTEITLRSFKSNWKGFIGTRLPSIGIIAAINDRINTPTSNTINALIAKILGLLFDICPIHAGFVAKRMPTMGISIVNIILQRKLVPCERKVVTRDHRFSSNHRYCFKTDR